MEEFNLNKHPVEEIPGKYLDINGVKYIFRDIIEEGENARIYLLKNAQSGISQFVGKVLKLDKQSELYRQISQTKIDNSFRLNLEMNSAIALHTEIYEVNGTLLKFQEYSGGLLPDEADAYLPAFMNQAYQHFQNGEYQKGVDVYAQVLAQNPNHTNALINIAAGYAYLGKSEEAIPYLLQALAVDKNFRPIYFLLAGVYQALEKPELAIYALELTLERWAYDSQVLTELIDICLEYDFLDKAKAQIALIHDYLGLSLEEYFLKIPELKEKVLASQGRINEYNRLLAEAFERHHKQQYQEAEPILAQAMAISKNNGVAEFNFYLCKYYLGERAITHPLLQLYDRINDLTRKTYCLLLCILIAVERENYPFAIKLVELLAGMLKDGSINKYDLPRIPYYYYQDYAIENLDIKPILSKLMILQQNIGSQESVDLLLENYQQLSEE